MKETWGEAFKDIKKDLRNMEQRVARLEQEARQTRLVMEADGPADMKTRERTEGAPKRSTGIAILHRMIKTDRRSRSVSA